MTVPSIQLRHIEISRFRRLRAVRVDLDDETTVLAGANNSGKTSILSAVRYFLSESNSLSAFDLSLCEWPRLRKLGERWEQEPADTASADELELWESELRQLVACMPALDLWFEVNDRSAFQLVAPFIPSLRWSGGLVGVRLRLEPAASVEEVQALAAKYRASRAFLRGLDAPTAAWPVDLIDYWDRHPKELGRIVAYKLDPQKMGSTDGQLDGPQELSPRANPIDKSSLAPLLKVDFVPAQRGLGVEEASGRRGAQSNKLGLFSSQMLRLAQRQLGSGIPVSENHSQLIAAIAKAQDDLDGKVANALGPAIKDVRSLGYPGLHDPQGMHFRTRIQATDLLNHGAAVKYSLNEEDDTFLPEQSIGLGYQNLQSLSFQLVAFREERLSPEGGSPAAVHLVLLEEPEAHLHVQVQRRFPTHAQSLLSPTGTEYEHLATQLVLTTHSSHLTHAVDFDRIRYIRRQPVRSEGLGPATEVVNLANVFGDDGDTKTFAERYFRVQHTDLLFADAAIFVEGTAERMLVPMFIERDFEALRVRHVSFVDVGGSHVHRLRPLVERLAIPTLVITDVDPVREEKKGNRTVRKSVPIDDPDELLCGNQTLKRWHPQADALKELSNGSNCVWRSSGGAEVWFAWQKPILPDGSWPSSFEDALVLSNLDWFRQHADEPGSLSKAAEIVAQNNSAPELVKQLHGMLRGSFNKGEFAATLFEKMCNEDIDGSVLQCPEYILTALRWLQGKLEPTRAGGVP